MGAVFGLLAGYYYWVGKITGYVYSEVIAKIHFWSLFIGVSIFAPYINNFILLVMRNLFELFYYLWIICFTICSASTNQRVKTFILGFYNNKFNLSDLPILLKYIIKTILFDTRKNRYIIYIRYYLTNWCQIINWHFSYLMINKFKGIMDKLGLTASSLPRRRVTKIYQKRTSRIYSVPDRKVFIIFLNKLIIYVNSSLIFAYLCKKWLWERKIFLMLILDIFQKKKWYIFNNIFFIEHVDKNKFFIKNSLNWQKYLIILVIIWTCVVGQIIQLLINEKQKRWCKLLIKSIFSFLNLYRIRVGFPSLLFLNGVSLGLRIFILNIKLTKNNYFVLLVGVKFIKYYKAIGKISNNSRWIPVIYHQLIYWKNLYSITLTFYVKIVDLIIFQLPSMTIPSIWKNGLYYTRNIITYITVVIIFYFRANPPYSVPFERKLGVRDSIFIHYSYNSQNIFLPGVPGFRNERYESQELYYLNIKILLRLGYLFNNLACQSSKGAKLVRAPRREREPSSLDIQSYYFKKSWIYEPISGQSIIFESRRCLINFANVSHNVSYLNSFQLLLRVTNNSRRTSRLLKNCYNYSTYSKLGLYSPALINPISISSFIMNKKFSSFFGMKQKVGNGDNTSLIKYKAPQRLNTKDIAWLVGFTEGDGCFTSYIETRPLTKPEYKRLVTEKHLLSLVKECNSNTSIFNLYSKKKIKKIAGQSPFKKLKWSKNLNDDLHKVLKGEIQIRKNQPRCQYEIGLEIRDIKLLYYIKKQLNCGTITIFNNIAHYRIKKLSHLLYNILPVFDNYPLLTKNKYQRYIDFRKILLERIIKSVKSDKEDILYAKSLILNPPIYCSNFSVLANNNKNLHLNDWISGFTTADGSFYFIKDNNKKIIRAEFALTQTNEQQVIEFIRNRINIKILVRENLKNSKHWVLCCGSKQDISKVIKFFDENKLKGYKLLSFNKWKIGINKLSRYN